MLFNKKDATAILLFGCFFIVPDTLDPELTGGCPPGSALLIMVNRTWLPRR
jgi:hypothetical protein